MENSKEPDLKSKTRKENKPINRIKRREFIKNSFLGALGFAVGARLGFNSDELSTSSQQVLEHPQKLPDVAYRQPKDEQPNLDAYKNSLKNSEGLTSNNELSISGVIEDLFPKYKNKEKEVLNGKVNKAVSYFENQRYPDRRSLEEIVEKSLRWKGLVNEEIAKMQLSEEFLNSGIPDLIPSLIFVESEGNPAAYNEVSGATGLTQVMPETAKELAQKLNMKSFDLRDPQTSIRFALKYLSDWYDYIPEVGLSLWNYHLGPGNLLDIVRAKVGNWNVDFDSLASVISENELNLANLVESPYAKKQISDGVLGDMTEEYVSRIVAANYFQKQFNIEKSES